MTENEMLKIAVHCLGVQAEQEVCEECDIYGNCHTDCKDVAVVAIKALEEIQQYRKIGTVEECREAVEKQKGMQVNEIHVDEYFCPACGSENNCDYGKVHDKYCPICGHAIYQEESEEK